MIDDEIERQLSRARLAAEISPFMTSLTHPSHEMWDEAVWID